MVMGWREGQSFGTPLLRRHNHDWRRLRPPVRRKVSRTSEAWRGVNRAGISAQTSFFLICWLRFGPKCASRISVCGLSDSHQPVADLNFTAFPPYSPSRAKAPQGATACSPRTGVTWLPLIPHPGRTFLGFVTTR